ncbi:MAG: GIY-YIG nuclease family protein, partial [Candidatus Eremiobacteraeota bacterium]|nr:GIY-YIG nuclease family protein [Candidatus Eremiobacteraeota bacterium]
CRDGSYYVGVTSDVEARFAQHVQGTFPTCYTYERRPLKLVYSATFATAAEAIRSEKQIKGWSHAKKYALARDDWDTISTLARSDASASPGDGDASTSSA